MEIKTLATALEREHREIDEGIAEFTVTVRGENPDREPLLRAILALRRHTLLAEQPVMCPDRLVCVGACDRHCSHSQGQAGRVLIPTSLVFIKKLKNGEYEAPYEQKNISQCWAGSSWVQPCSSGGTAASFSARSSPRMAFVSRRESPICRLSSSAIR